MVLKKWVLVSLISIFSLNMAQAESTEKSSSSINIHTNPVMWLVGYYSLGADVSITNKLTLGGSYNHVTFDDNEFDEDIDAKGNGVDLRVQYFLNEAFQSGWYLSGFGSFNKGEVEDTSNGDFAKFKIRSVGVTAGYFWRWDHFNIQLGLGLQNSSVSVSSSTLNAQDRQDIEDLSGVGATGDFRIGLAF